MSIRRPVLTPAMKMAELLDTHFTVPGVFNRMGLRYGFGEASVEEVCRNAGIDPAAFLLVCRAYAREDYRPTVGELREAGLRDIIAYLRLSHRFYLDNALAGLGAALEEMSRPCDARSREILHRFFLDYRDELARHFAYEEETVFPYLESFLAGTPEGRFPAGEFGETHESLEEKLEDLKSLVMKYMPPECEPEQQRKAVFLLYALDLDIKKHIVLEDTLLTPMLSLRERNALEGRGEETAEQTEEDPLSQREKEILVCVAKGMLNKEIADCLHLSIHTVTTHRKNITRKTGIKTVAGLTVYALLNRLIDMNTVE